MTPDSFIAFMLVLDFIIVNLCTTQWIIHCFCPREVNHE